MQARIMIIDFKHLLVFQIQIKVYREYEKNTLYVNCAFVNTHWL